MGTAQATFEGIKSTGKKLRKKVREKKVRETNSMRRTYFRTGPLPSRD
jgi:hypothetical protein